MASSRVSFHVMIMMVLTVCGCLTGCSQSAEAPKAPVTVPVGSPAANPEMQAARQSRANAMRDMGKKRSELMRRGKAGQ